MQGKEYSSNELQYLPKEDMIKDCFYDCHIPSDPNARRATLMWNGHIFLGHINGPLNHVDTGRRIGKCYPVAIATETITNAKNR